MQSLMKIHAWAQMQVPLYKMFRSLVTLRVILGIDACVTN